MGPAERAKVKETLEEELAYRTQHLETLREYLTTERERIIKWMREDDGAGMSAKEYADVLALGLPKAEG